MDGCKWGSAPPPHYGLSAWYPLPFWAVGWGYQFDIKGRHHHNQDAFLAFISFHNVPEQTRYKREIIDSFQYTQWWDYTVERHLRSFHARSVLRSLGSAGTASEGRPCQRSWWVNGGRGLRPHFLLIYIFLFAFFVAIIVWCFVEAIDFAVSSRYHVLRGTWSHSFPDGSVVMSFLCALARNKCSITGLTV